MRTETKGQERMREMEQNKTLEIMNRAQEMVQEEIPKEKGRIDPERFGSFIALRRREKGLTQSQLAEQLYVTNKAVSKWETGGSHS